MMQNRLILLLVATSILLVWWILKPEDRANKKYPREAKTAQQAPANPAPLSFPKKVTLMPIASTTEALNTQNSTPEEDLSLIHSLLRFHRKALGSNPVGLNDEITSALTGKNLKGAASLPPDHQSISEQGELLDRWGTPYRFHAYSGKLMEVHSAGPDRRFFTEDDLKLME